MSVSTKDTSMSMPPPKKNESRKSNTPVVTYNLRRRPNNNQSSHTKINNKDTSNNENKITGVCNNVDDNSFSGDKYTANDSTFDITSVFNDDNDMSLQFDSEYEKNSNVFSTDDPSFNITDVPTLPYFSDMLVHHATNNPFLKDVMSSNLEKVSQLVDYFKLPSYYKKKFPASNYVLSLMN